VDGEYRLKAQIGGVGHLAYAKVQLSDAQYPSVVLDDHIFAWVFDVYGPNAWTNSLFFDDLRNGARSGALYALHRTRSNHLVRVMEVGGGPADATEPDVRFVVAHAVWNALGHAPDVMPSIDDTGAFHFPNPPHD